MSELRWCELGEEVWLCACAECSDVSDSIDSPSDRRPLAEYVLLKRGRVMTAQNGQLYFGTSLDVLFKTMKLKSKTKIKSNQTKRCRVYNWPLKIGLKEACDHDRRVLRVIVCIFLRFILNT